MSKSVVFANGFSIFICVFTWISFIGVVFKQHGFLKNETYRLQVLSTRCALALPIYATIVLFSLLYPHTFFALEVVVSLFEGYSFYCYFAFVVTNLGGPNSAVTTMKENGRQLCCSCCCPEDRAAVYNRTLWNEWHFIFTRTLVVLIATIFKAFGNEKVFVVLSIIAFAILVNGVMSVVNFYENVMNECANLKGILKFLVIKVSVGLLVFQTIVTELVLGLGKCSLHDNKEFDCDDRSLRLVCECLFYHPLRSVFLYINIHLVTLIYYIFLLRTFICLD